jgi:hypothetical protein
MARILLWNSIATRRRSTSDTFLENGLGRLKAYLESSGHEVVLEDWATDTFYAGLSFPLVARPLRALYRLLLPGREMNLPAPVRKLLGATSMALQGIQSFVMRRRMESHLRSLAIEIGQNGFRVMGMKLWYGEAFYWAKKLAGMLQKTAPALIVVAGGYHVTLYEGDILRYDSFDVGVRGEGEYALSEILSIVDRMAGRPKAEILEAIAARRIDNTLCRKGETVVMTPKREALPEKKAIPFYGETPGKVRIHVVVESLGCPWGKCNFCVHPHFHTRYAPRSIEDLIYEMKFMADQGIGIFRLAGSDTLPSFGARIAQAILDAGLQVVYGMGSRAVTNCSEPAIFAKTVQHYETLLRSGLRSVFMGGETGHDRINREVMNKGITRKDLVSTSAAIREAEKRVGQKLDLVLALIHPVPLIEGVSQEEVFQRDLDLVAEVKPDSVIVSPPGPFKQSRWYAEKERFGFELDESIIPTVMEYEYVLYKPLTLWPKLDIGLQGQSFAQVLNECLRLRKAIDKMNIATDLSDEHFLMLRPAGYAGEDGAKRFKEETVLDIVSCDYRHLTEISKKINRATRTPRGTPLMSQASPRERL